MQGAFGTRQHRRRPTINITSLIDVMFLLLIFLLVSTTFRGELGVDITLPQAQTAVEQPMDPNEVVVTESGDYYFGQQKVDEDGLRTAMTKVLKDDPDATLVLRADDGADFGRVIRAVDIARALGGKKLVIPAQPIKGSPQGG